MKHVLIILDNGFDPDVRVYKEAVYLLSIGYEVTIYAWDRENRHSDRPMEVYNNVKIVRFFISSVYGSGVKQAGALMKFALACRKALREDKRYDYIHCPDLNGILVGVITGAKRRYKSKIVFDMKEFYGSGNLRRFRVPIRWIVRQMHNRSDWIIYLNDRQKKDITSRNTSKLVYLPNYPEKSKFFPKEKTPSNRLRVSFIGFVRYEKQLEALIDAAFDYQGEIEVYIHGGGVSCERIKKYAESYENCHVTGGFKHDNVNRLYQNTDVLYFAYDSDEENDKTSFPTKFFEAIITNTPMIVADGTFHGDYCREKYLGFCVSKDYKRDIQKIFELILADRNILKVMAENERRLENEYLWETIVRNLDVIYS